MADEAKTPAAAQGQEAPRREAPLDLSKVTTTYANLLSHYTAKRLLAHLHYALKRHEEIFGQLEMDFRKRMRRQG